MLSRLLPIARGLALFLSLFTLLNILRNLLSPGFDSNIWWIDLRGLTIREINFDLSVGALALLIFALRPPSPTSRTLRFFVQAIVAFLLLVALLNAATFYVLMLRHKIHPGIPIPLSLLIAVSLTLILITIRTPSVSEAPSSFSSSTPQSKLKNPNSKILFALTFLACLIAFPLAQMYCFGKTDYRRHADAIVVFGALAHPDGTPSQALEDRVRTALALYHQGYAPLLIFTGGPSQGPLSEPDVMRNLALADGIPDSAILLDQSGLHTDASVTNTVQLFHQHNLHTILAVSHFYHLPRIKMTYARALIRTRSVSEGAKTSPFNETIEVLTVPAHESRPLIAMPHFILREILALYAYYLRPLLLH